VSGDPSFTELLARIRATDLAAFSHADVPFEAVVERLNPARSPARNPLFQVMVGYHNRTADELRLPGLRVADVPFRIRSAKFDLVFSFTEQTAADGEDGTLGCRLEYATELFDQESAEQLAECLRRLVAAVAGAPEQPVSRAEILAPGEREVVLDRFNATAREVEEASLPALFARQVAERPDTVAVVERSESLSYAQLDAAARPAGGRLRAFRPDRTPAGRAGSGCRERGRRGRAPLGRHGRHGARRPQTGGRLPAAGPGPPRRPARLHDRGLRGRRRRRHRAGGREDP
jgi:non-ribosomal peptide synthetase component F